MPEDCASLFPRTVADMGGEQCAAPAGGAEEEAHWSALLQLPARPASPCPARPGPARADPPPLVQVTSYKLQVTSYNK